MMLVSACLAGKNCTHRGKNDLRRRIAWAVREGAAIPVCPEELGGLGTPREAAEIVGGSGEDVFRGRAKVFTRSRRDVTDMYIAGARRTLEIAKERGLTRAVMKALSPSCGCGYIYDGTFTKRRVCSNGVTAALLIENGISVCTEEEFLKLRHGDS